MSGIDIFTSEYLGKVFYFCLKKTGDEQDAAELAGEVSLEVVQALSRGKEPERFDAWLWAVVRNRWARWAAGKYYRAPEGEIRVAAVIFSDGMEEKCREYYCQGCCFWMFRRPFIGQIV